MIPTPREKLEIALVGGDGQETIESTGNITRTVFDGPDTATYDWLILDLEGKPVTGRSQQHGDQVIVETYPVQPGFVFYIIDCDTPGTMEVILWSKA